MNMYSKYVMFDVLADVMCSAGCNDLDDALDLLATYMDDDIREQVCSELAPCEPEDFLERYLELDPGFADLLCSEFRVDVRG